MFTDLSGDDLRQYRSSQTCPSDFDAFWDDTLAAARRFDLDLALTPHPSPLVTLDTYDVRFNGYGGQPVRAWLRVPASTHEPLPVVVEMVGYGGGRGLAEDGTFWASCGFAHLHMDSRGQGATWSQGVTPDTNGVGPHVPGVMTAGIETAGDYYYRRLITDAVRLVDAVPEIAVADSSRITVLGTSQGGGLALAVAGLSPHVGSLVSYVPFLCDFPRAITVTDDEPYKEISRYLAVHRDKQEQVMHTLSYFDGVNFAKRATAPALFTTGLMDSTCPPSTVVGAYQEYAGPKALRIWTHNGHEGGGSDDDVRVATALKAGRGPDSVGDAQ